MLYTVFNLIFKTAYNAVFIIMRGVVPVVYAGKRMTERRIPVAIIGNIQCRRRIEYDRFHTIVI